MATHLHKQKQESSVLLKPLLTGLGLIGWDNMKLNGGKERLYILVRLNADNLTVLGENLHPGKQQLWCMHLLVQQWLILFHDAPLKRILLDWKKVVVNFTASPTPPNSQETCNICWLMTACCLLVRTKVVTHFSVLDQSRVGNSQTLPSASKAAGTDSSSTMTSGDRKWVDRLV